MLPFSIPFDWVWLLAGLTGLGGAGLIALFLFAPAAAAVVSNTIWSVMQTRLGIAIACLLSGLYFGDFHRAKVDHTQAKRAQIEALARQQKINDEIEAATRKDVEVRMENLQKQLDERSQQVTDYEKRLSGPRCPVGADAGRLRAIAGSK